MERPVITVDRTKSVRTPDITSPLRPSPLRGSPLRASPLRAGHRPSPLKASGGGPLKPPGAAPWRAPWQSPLDRAANQLKANAGRRAREIRRQHVILPQLGRRLWPEGELLYMPYEEICYIMEWVVGQFTYSPGMGEESQEDWCATGREGEHLHLFGAFPRFRGHPAPQMVDLSHYSDNGWYVDEWRTMRDMMRHCREEALEDPEKLLGLPLTGGDIAVHVLKAAGFDLPDGLHRAERLVQLVRDNLATDESVRDAFGDMVALQFSHLGEMDCDPSELIEEATEGEVHMWDPDELTFLTFDPADFGPEDRINSGVMLRGDFLAVDATYRSALMLPDEVSDEMPFVTGWREIAMTPSPRRTPGGSAWQQLLPGMAAEEARRSA